MALFQAVYGRTSPTLPIYTHSPNDTLIVQQKLMERDKLLTTLKGNFMWAQQVMKAQADKHIKDVPLEMGDQVLVKLQPCRQNSVALRQN